MDQRKVDERERKMGGLIEGLIEDEMEHFMKDEMDGFMERFMENPMKRFREVEMERFRESFREVEMERVRERVREGENKYLGVGLWRFYWAGYSAGFRERWKCFRERWKVVRDFFVLQHNPVFGPISSGSESGTTKSISRKVLPMLIGRSPLDAIADTGSDENAMTESTARGLGIAFSTKPKHRREFEVASGKKIYSSGRAIVECAFPERGEQKMRCAFNIFPHLITPLIMGRQFLDNTETLTKHSHRLRDRVLDACEPRRVMYLTRPARRVRCTLNLRPVLANADTGSEADLVSYDYVRRAGLTMESPEDGYETIQFADGTFGRISGKVVADLHIDDNVNGALRAVTTKRTLHVLQGLTTDVLLGEELLFQMHVFTDHSQAFVDITYFENFPQLNAITWLRQVDRSLLQLFNRTREKPPKSSKDVVESVFLQALEEDDARELHRQEQADIAIDHITDLNLQNQAEAVEQAIRTTYNDHRSRRVQDYYNRNRPPTRHANTNASSIVRR